MRVTTVFWEITIYIKENTFHYVPYFYSKKTNGQTGSSSLSSDLNGIAYPSPTHRRLYINDKKGKVRRGEANANAMYAAVGSS
jgi:hypothetical protein